MVWWRRYQISVENLQEIKVFSFASSKSMFGKSKFDILSVNLFEEDGFRENTDRSFIERKIVDKWTNLFIDFVPSFSDKILRRHIFFPNGSKVLKYSNLNDIKDVLILCFSNMYLRYLP